jgi:hypothetical protein
MKAAGGGGGGGGAGLSVPLRAGMIGLRSLPLGCPRRFCTSGCSAAPSQLSWTTREPPVLPRLTPPLLFSPLLAGDAWRETWREAIVVEHNANQPSVERSAHKWAKNGGVRRCPGYRDGVHAAASGELVDSARPAAPRQLVCLSRVSEFRTAASLPPLPPPTGQRVGGEVGGALLQRRPRGEVGRQVGAGRGGRLA